MFSTNNTLRFMRTPRSCCEIKVSKKYSPKPPMPYGLQVLYGLYTVRNIDYRNTDILVDNAICMPQFLL